MTPHVAALCDPDFTCYFLIVFCRLRFPVKDGLEIDNDRNGRFLPLFQTITVIKNGIFGEEEKVAFGIVTPGDLVYDTFLPAMTSEVLKQRV